MSDRATCKRCDMEAEGGAEKNEDLVNVRVYNPDTGKCIYCGNMCLRHRVEYEVAFNYRVKKVRACGFIKSNGG